VIIGFSGKALSGKDTSADFILEEFRFDEKVGFASNLKAAVIEIFNLSVNDVYDQNLKGRLLEEPVITNSSHAQKILDWMRRTHKTGSINLERFTSKTLTSPRDILQFVGTDVMRSICYTYHTDIIESKLTTGKKIVICDVRFHNEIDLIKRYGGFVVRIHRNIGMCGSKTGHQSEIALDNFEGWDYTLDNNGSFSDLYSSISKMISIFSEREKCQPA
jgi:hypothetical protein